MYKELVKPKYLKQLCHVGCPPLTSLIKTTKQRITLSSSTVSYSKILLYEVRKEAMNNTDKIQLEKSKTNRPTYLLF